MFSVCRYTIHISFSRTYAHHTAKATEFPLKNTRDMTSLQSMEVVTLHRNQGTTHIFSNVFFPFLVSHYQ